ncbi:MAG: hypothetical protein HY099_06680 [Nitrospirae bacterium]|nr:hypothetical protein [Nitrospirota bacterium]
MIGIGLILWGYYQLFGVDTERSYINKNITALTSKGAVAGRVVSIKGNTVIMVSNNSTFEIPKHSIYTIESLFVDQYETRRVLFAVSISTGGGLLVWISLFLI